MVGENIKSYAMSGINNVKELGLDLVNRVRPCHSGKSVTQAGLDFMNRGVNNRQQLLKGTVCGRRRL